MDRKKKKVGERRNQIKEREGERERRREQESEKM